MSAARGLLERRLDAWARWVVSAGVESGAPTLLARWMDGKGHIVFGGGSSEPADVIETLIESAVLKMAIAYPLRADILRLEFGAGCYGVAERQGIKGYDPRNMTQSKHAHALKISVRTYRSRLAEAKQVVNEALKAALSSRGK